MHTHKLSPRALCSQLRTKLKSLRKCVLVEFKQQHTPAQLQARVDWCNTTGASFFEPRKPNTWCNLVISSLPHNSVEQRLAAAIMDAHNTSMPRIQQIVWVDQKQFYISPKGKFMAWGLADDDERQQHGGPADRSVVKTHGLSKVCNMHPSCKPVMSGSCISMCRVSTCLQSSFKGWRIYYYAAVSWFTGAVHIQLTSGTKGKGFKTKYQVCCLTSTCLILGWLPQLNITNLKPCCLHA
jgi:hypothetical protein